MKIGILIFTTALAFSCANLFLRQLANAPDEGEFCLRGEVVLKNPLVCSLHRAEFGAYYQGSMFILKTRVLSAHDLPVLELSISYERGPYTKNFYALSIEGQDRPSKLTLLPTEDAPQETHSVEGESYSSQAIVLTRRGDRLGVESFSLVSGEKTMVVSKVEKLSG